MGTLYDSASDGPRLPPLLSVLVISALCALSWAMVIAAVSVVL